jgi:DNA-3-methyladenine glycosylase
MIKRSRINKGFVTLDRGFFTRDVLKVAPDLIGKILIVTPGASPERGFMITEVEAYKGSSDKACHASKGRTARTEVMYDIGGKIYVYFVYGMYWMLNFVTGEIDEPQAVLIRGVEGISGPGRITRELLIDGSFYGEDLTSSEKIRVADSGIKPSYTTGPRIGIGYAGEPWISKHWRFLIRR